MDLLKYFRKKEKPFVPGRIINMWDHYSWGNNILWSDWENRKVTGWMREKPKVDDELRCKLVSGKIGRFRFFKVKNADNVHDMFFAEMEDVGYLPDGEESIETPDNGKWKFI